MKKLKNNYEVIVLGSGVAGHSCVVKCAELGLDTLCIDVSNYDQIYNNHSTNFENLSIIALLESAKLYETIAYTANKHGIYTDNIAINLHEMVARKNAILEDVNKCLINTIKQLKIDFINTDARLLSTGAVQVSSRANEAVDVKYANHIVLATDSLPITLPCAAIDNKFILDSTASLNLQEIPKSIAILGAGIIGLEIAGIWNRLGTRIIILEAQDSFLNVTDHQISSIAYQIFSEQDLEIRLGTRVISTKVINSKVVVEFQDSEGTHAIKVDKLIVASGRRPNSEKIAAPEANLLLDEHGFVHTNEKYKTNLPNVYAIGDLTMHGPMLSHKGIAEGHYIAERLAGLTVNPINYNTIPSIIYTEPEIAWVGKSEQTLKSMGESITSSTYLINNNFKAKAINKTSGVIKLITSSISDEILGAHAIGAFASEIIAEAALAIEFSANREDLTRAIHSHPSLNEAYYEVGLLSRNTYS